MSCVCVCVCVGEGVTYLLFQSVSQPFGMSGLRIERERERQTDRSEQRKGNTTACVEVTVSFLSIVHMSLFIPFRWVCDVHW